MQDVAQDFEAALGEVESNLDVRRLLLVTMHVLLPALALTVAEGLAAAVAPAGMQWFQQHILAIGGGVLCAAGAIVCVVLARCHFGLVVNGSKLGKLQTGAIELRGLNWLGVTTNFVALTALAAAGGLALLLGALGLGILPSLVAAFALFFACFLVFRLNHGRANQLVRRLESHWEPGELSREQREDHVQLSLRAANADISIVVTMAAALFAGLFNAMTIFLGVADRAGADFSANAMRETGPLVLAAYLWFSLVLSLRMLLRLRIAVGVESSRLAELREEPDDPWRFRVLERGFLLFQLTAVLAAAALLMFVACFASPWLAGGLALLQLVAGTLWWGFALRRRRA